MTASTDIAGVVGTWVAVFLALVALVGIAGPLLVWRATLTDRHQALNATKDSGEFISKGIRVGSNIQLFRQINAPLLKSEPRVDGMNLVWDSTASRALDAFTGWVELSLVLRAYGFDYHCGDSLVIEDKQTWLPVNRAWILWLGIIGAFGHRADQGKLTTRSLHVRFASLQAIPGTRKGRQLTPVWETATNYKFGVRPNLPSRSTYFGQLKCQPLYGLIGTLFMPSSMDSFTESEPDYQQAFYTNHSPDESGALLPHPLPLSSLFWLAVGCLPAADGRVFSLEDVIDMPPEEPSQTSHRRRLSMSGVHFVAGDNTKNDHNDDIPRSRRQLSANMYVAHEQLPNDQSGPSAERGFRLNIAKERNEELSHIARVVGADNADVFSIEEVELASATKQEFQEDAGKTYVPAESIWVRMGTDTPLSKDAWFMRRADAQQLAQVLLELDLHAQGYLLGGSRDSRCRQTLCNAANSLPQLLARMIPHAEYFVPKKGNAKTLLAAMEQMMSRTLEVAASRAMTAAIFDLDQALKELMHPNPKVHTAIGVLMITNAEFRAMIAQSARHLDTSLNPSVQLDLHEASLIVPSTFGIMQHFPLDFDVLYTNGVVDGDLMISIKHSTIMLSALRASLRSAFLVASIDSLPLFESVMNSQGILHFG
jgi:hypothetical protein